MNTNELKCMLSRDMKMNQKCINVFALDEFKDFVKRNKTLLEGLYIVNDQISSQPGNHWLTVFYENDYLAFVDSFAKSPEYYNIQTELMSTSNKFIDEIPYTLQHILSDVCGEYAIYFSYNLCRGKRLYNILENFSYDCNENDEKVVNFVHKIFPGHKR